MVAAAAAAASVEEGWRRGDCCTALHAAERAHPARELASPVLPLPPRPPQWRCLLQMSDSPAGSNPRTPESSGSGSGGGGKRPAVPAAVSLLPPADPLRQANRLPIRVLKMLSAHTGHLLHPEYLQPLSSTPVSPIEVSVLVSARSAPSPFRPPPPGPRPYSRHPVARRDAQVWPHWRTV